jgi:DNA-binding XRE family transcriptional regulator
LQNSEITGCNRNATNNCVIVGGATTSTDDKLEVSKKGEMDMAVSIVYIIAIVLLGVFGTLITLIIRALLKYIKSKDVREEKAKTQKSLGEAIKEHRTRCKMTQEFVAETLGVSRQAVTKWESGISDPSTSNLVALAKLYGISAEDLLKEVEG